MYNDWEPRVPPLLNPSKMLMYNIKKFNVNNSNLLQITEIWKLTLKSSRMNPAMLVTYVVVACDVCECVGLELITSQRANTV